VTIHPSRTPHPLEVARRLRGLTQAELALRAGLSREALNLIETGRRSPRLATMTAIADALGVSLGALFDGGDLTAERLAALADKMSPASAGTEPGSKIAGERDHAPA
jgi:transcriptional regulator with XRE-family HTH domain